MWSDIETTEDLLGYFTHASLIKEVVTNEKNLPITVGLYGDWGSGKSSILKILEEQLKRDDDVVVVYFDGWSFESFDDAKMALIQGIVDSLEDEEKFFAKVGDKASKTYEDLKKAFKDLRKSINWMRVLKVTTKSVIPIATSIATGGASLLPMLLTIFSENKENLKDILTGSDGEKIVRSIVNAEEEEKKYKAVREFRKDFESLIKKSKQGKIVILIDDLDRCLPRHIIDNLEAIKLFLNVPKTAFVIAADKYIVSNAIKSEYKEVIKAAEDDHRPNLGDSYMEKFIQLPYIIPALSPKEVETYVTLLFCKSILDKESFEQVQQNFAAFVLKSKFDKYCWNNIKEILKDSAPAELKETIGFVSHFSSIIGNSLRWNPRLIKRFMNAYEIRSCMLAQSGITDSKTKFALLKLMLIEQKYIEQFKQLNSWVMNSLNTPMELAVIENFADGVIKELKDFQDWNKPDLLTLVSTEPKFSSIDMKELFWVSRDNIVDQMSGLTLISTRIKSIFAKVYNASTDPIRETACKSEISGLLQDELNDIFDLIDVKILTNPNEKNGYSVYFYCIMNDVSGAYNRFLEILSRTDTTKIPFALGNKFKDILSKYNNDNKLLGYISKNEKLMRTINS